MEKEMITYEDFAKLDIVLGTIVSVEPIEGADKLLKLQVEVGEVQPRQIVSGCTNSCWGTMPVCT
jgi:methionyl-tRNA synthetase